VALCLYFSHLFLFSFCLRCNLQFEQLSTFTLSFHAQVLAFELVVFYLILLLFMLEGVFMKHCGWKGFFNNYHAYVFVYHHSWILDSWTFDVWLCFISHVLSPIASRWTIGLLFIPNLWVFIRKIKCEATWVGIYLQ